MKPTIALVGRPNVGKSTLFNRLTHSRAALVADFPGLTRDRHYGEARFSGKSFYLVDTGGFEPVAKDGIMREMAKQAKQAIDESDIVVFLCDGRDGLTVRDGDIAQLLRRSGRKCFLVVNKAEGMQRERVAAEFFELGLGQPYVISSAHGDGIGHLMEDVLADTADDDIAETEFIEPEVTPQTEKKTKFQGITPNERISIALAGRPNVGKSSLTNALLGEERVIAFDEPGTTRDAIALDFERDGKPYTLIDTAGIRRRGKTTEMVEKFSVIKTMQAITDANVVVLVLDPIQGITEQDSHIAGFALEQGRALVVAFNKWDATDAEQREQAKQDFERRMYFLDFAETVLVSARAKSGLKGLLAACRAAYESAMMKMPTPMLTRALQAAIAQQQPARQGQSRPKMRYAHQGGQNPPLIIIHGNSLDKIPATYKRFLEHYFRKAFNLKGTPLRIEFKSAENPYKNS